MHAFLAEVAKDSLGIPEYSSSLEFFKAGFSLTDDDRFKKFDIKFSPWVSTLCEWFDGNQYTWINLIFGSQLSKTTFQMGILLYISKYMRGAVPVLWVQSTEEEAKLFISERLHAFIEESGKDAIKKGTWKREAFRMNNAAVKVGFATSKNSLRSKPARFVIGDECGVWKESISYTKKRTRTFLGKRKGVFATTPPDFSGHHSMGEMTSANFYERFVPCPDCGHMQNLVFKQLDFADGRREDGSWDYGKVKSCAGYRCISCNSKWMENQKLDIVNKGEERCVDYRTKEEIKPDENCESATLRISALYSSMYTWGQLACDFLYAKSQGPMAMKHFMCDELAEIQEDHAEERVEKKVISRFIDFNRPAGFREGYDLYTAGIDVQKEDIYYVVLGWRAGSDISAHVLDYDLIGYRDASKSVNWGPLKSALLPYQNYLYRICIDATDGNVKSEIENLCWTQGNQFVPLIDMGAKQKEKYVKKNNRANPRKFNLQINSDHFKDEIASAFRRSASSEGAWTFPSNACDRFISQVSNEHKVRVKHGNGFIEKWVPRYAGAPQHLWCCLTYAVAAMEEMRFRLQKTERQPGYSPYNNRRRTYSRGIR